MTFEETLAQSIEYHLAEFEKNPPPPPSAEKVLAVRTLLGLESLVPDTGGTA